MQLRHAVRYDTHLLPNSLNKVTISWGMDSSSESSVANFCAHGMGVVVPLSIQQMEAPKKNDAIKVKLPFVHMWLTGMCIYAKNEIDGSTSVGIYFYVPTEQNYLNKLLSNNLHVPLQEFSFVCHEWNEFVEKLCNSEDPKLKNIGIHEKGILVTQ
jgi:hypothetical protein